ncbi:MAG: four helix bundle protein, partial [Candidatus Sulfomarinibacteraceae bacterium]
IPPATRSGWTGCMNNTEVTMHTPPTGTGFDALDKAIQGAQIAVALALKVPAPMKSIGDQLIRAASSVPANLAEGQGRSGRDRLHHYSIAYASAKEVDVRLRILCLSHPAHRGNATTALQLFDDVRAMTWRLLHPRA